MGPSVGSASGLGVVVRVAGSLPMWVTSALKVRRCAAAVGEWDTSEREREGNERAIEREIERERDG
jgi:hypothetical protein